MTLLDEYLEASPSLRDQATPLLRAAESDAVILIVGEPGSGRTSLARALHAVSDRRHGPLIEVDPGVVPSTLFESEFFGYRAGAFTGAEKSNSGRVALAEGGTLVLDPVEELPLPVQPKLLRLLAEKRYSPLADKERSADVRFIAIGSEQLPSLVKRGAFRADLYYRLEVLAFRVPPLRERKQDLPTLVCSVLDDLARRHGRDELSLSEDARVWMAEYMWPGNLRELRNLLEREVVMVTDGPLDPTAPTASVSRKPRSLAEVEEEAILSALRYTRGHQGRAAELLGISRKALWEKRRRLGLP